MQDFTKINDLRAYLKAARSSGKTIGFVPTMGFLHEGHTSLMNLAREKCDILVASIFVNPRQFNNENDLISYPRDLKRDQALLAAAKVDALFIPSIDELYGGNFETSVALNSLSMKYEGEFRPGHFAGVSTVVAILFNIVSPDFSIFGEKDFQQLRLVEQMVVDLKYNIQIIRGPTVRESDGLAMSSRNARLQPEEREAAKLLSQSLFQIRDAFKSGESLARNLRFIALKILDTNPKIKVEYVVIVDQESLVEAEQATTNTRVLIAAWVGEVRLIDNIALR